MPDTFFPLPGPNPAEGHAPDALFDLAVNRAATALRGFPQAGREAELRRWHARTRFARRIPVAEVQRCLGLRPLSGVWHWAGGPTGGWVAGKAPFP